MKAGMNLPDGQQVRASPTYEMPAIAGSGFAVRYADSFSDHQLSTIHHQLPSDGDRIRRGVFAGVGEADLDFGDAILLGKIGGVS